MNPDIPQPGASLQAVRARRAELRESIAALEQALAGPAPGRSEIWAERVRVVLTELSADLRLHNEIAEGSEGLHREVLTTAPRLGGAIRRLVDEHAEISRLVEELLARVSGPLDGVEDTRALGVALLSRLARHRQAGADMIYEAYQTDIGGET